MPAQALASILLRTGLSYRPCPARGIVETSLEVILPTNLEVDISKAKRKKSPSRARVRAYGSHVFVCKGKDCRKRGAKEVRRALKAELRAAGMKRDVRVDEVDCFGLCKHGPNAVVYPGGVWYCGLSEEDATELVESHLKNGNPVERLRVEVRPRRERSLQP